MNLKMYTHCKYIQVIIRSVHALFLQPWLELILMRDKWKEIAAIYLKIKHTQDIWRPIRSE